jgi:WD40 repeat protein
VLWDLATGKEIGEFETSSGVSHVVFSSGGKDRSVKIWGFETGAELFSGQGHTDRVTRVAFSADG